MDENKDDQSRTETDFIPDNRGFDVRGGDSPQPAGYDYGQRPYERQKDGLQRPEGEPVYSQQPESRPVYPQQPGGRPVYPQQPESQPVYPQQPESRPVYSQQPGGRPGYPYTENRAYQQNTQPVYQQYSNQPFEPQKPDVQKPDNMALAAMVMGIISIVTICCYFIGVIFSCLGIIFALLSLKGEKIKGTALTGLILSILSLIITLVIVIVLLIISTMSGGYY